MRVFCSKPFFILALYLGVISVLFTTLLANAQAGSCRKGQISELILKNQFNLEARYEPIFKKCNLDEGQLSVTAIRVLELAQKKFVLYVNNQDLTTDLVPESCLRACTDHLDATHDDQRTTNYDSALEKTTASPFPLHADGLKHELGKDRQVFLTIDLCPSHLPMDIELFRKIQKEQSAGSAKPVPVSISMSGSWLRHHDDDFQKLLKLQRENQIDITWVNHSFTHPYVKGISNDHNFLLTDGINLADEVFLNEKLFLKNGIIPSVFFRFPGLVSNQDDIQTLRRWGLIPLAADAWLANGEVAAIGSIILVHANGNEPQGLIALYKLMVDWPELKSLFAKINKAFTLN